jgi:hypothetical protein
MVLVFDMVFSPGGVDVTVPFSKQRDSGIIPASVQAALEYSSGVRPE